MAIKPDDVYPVLEKRVLGEIKNYLVAYKTIWGAYPFPAPFSNPTTAIYKGSIAETGGLLPINDAVLSWSGGTCSSVRASNGAVVDGSISIIGSKFTCTIGSQNYTGARTVTVNANLNNVGLGFYQQMDVTSTSDFQFTPAALKTTSVLSYSLNSSGGGLIKLVANPSTNTSTYTVVFNQLPDHDDWNTTAAIANYIYKNNWHNLIYYKVAPPFLPGGSGVCDTSCLTINKTTISPPSTVALANVHVLLMSAGRKIIATEALPAPTYNISNPAQSRPGNQLTDYFDSINNTSNGTFFDSKQSPLINFNDQIEIVE